MTINPLPGLNDARLHLESRLGAVANRFADRDDLVVECVWNPEPIPGQPSAPAWFTPSTSTITVNAKLALGDVDPADVNPLTPAGRRSNPVLIGLLDHEASHAHSTRWSEEGFGDVSPAVSRAAILLEEPRIERRQIERRPISRPYLRAQSAFIDLRAYEDGRSPEMDRWSAATAAIMVLARVDAGVLEPEDGSPVAPILHERLGDDLALLRAIWLDALELADGDVDGLLDAAQRWVEVVGEPPADGLPLIGCPSGFPGGSEVPQEDEWASPDDDPDPVPTGGLMAAMAVAVKSAVDGGTEEIEFEFETEELEKAAHDARKAEREQVKSDEKAQQKSVPTSETVFGLTGSIGRQRRPTQDEMRLARQIAEALKRAKFRERAVTTRSSHLPPGQFDGRQAMLGRAQKDLGIPVTAKPYRAKVRKYTPEPPITLGIMGDKSGSMMWAVDVMSTITWAFSHAVAEVHGRAASVAFGWNVVPITHPGTPPKMVTEIRATDGTEQFKKGFAALDGALNLTTGKGVRLLVVISDGLFAAPGEKKAAQEAVSRMVRNGGRVLWFFNTTTAHWTPEGVICVPVRGSQQSMEEVPAAIVAALAKAARA